MSRYGSRKGMSLISRALLGIVAVTLVIGLVFWFKSLTPAEDQPVAAAEPTELPEKTASSSSNADTPASVAQMRQNEAAVTVTPAIGQQAQTPAANPPESPRPQTTEAQPITTTANTPPRPMSALNVPASFLEDAVKLAEDGKLVDARALYNVALLKGNLTLQQADEVKQRMAEINQTLVFSNTHADNDPYTDLYRMGDGDLLSKVGRLYSTPWEIVARINSADPRRIRPGLKLKTIKGPVHAVVSKSRFTMDIYLGGLPEWSSPVPIDGVTRGTPLPPMYVTTLPVGLGSEGSTPLGVWYVDGSKLKNPTYFSPRGEGVIEANDPKNPLGERWIPLSGVNGKTIGQAGYGVHGTIDPDSIGTNASLGCIRLHNEDVELVYDLLQEDQSHLAVVP